MVIVILSVILGRGRDVGYTYLLIDAMPNLGRQTDEARGIVLYGRISPL